MTERQGNDLGLVRGFGGLPCLDQDHLGALTFRNVPGKPATASTMPSAANTGLKCIRDAHLLPWTGVERFIGQPFSAPKHF